jgi:hypothetical protein
MNLKKRNGVTKMDRTALRPSIFNVEAFKKDNEAVKRGVTDEERILYALSAMAGWKIVVDFKGRLIKDMEDANKDLMASGQSFDEIGKNAVVINLAESIVDRIINLVSDAKEACEADLNDK